MPSTNSPVTVDASEIIHYWRRLLRSAVPVYGASTALNSVVPVLLAPVLIAMLPPEDYAQITIFQILLYIMTVLIGLNMDSSLLREMVQLDIRQQRDYVSTILGGGSALAAILGVVCITGGSFIGSAIRFPPVLLLPVVGGAFSQTVVNVKLAVCQMTDRPWTYAVIRSGQSLLDLSLSIILVCWVRTGWTGRVTGSIAASGTAALFCLILLRREELLAVRFVKAYMRNAASFGAPLVPHLLGLYCISWGDRIIIINTLGMRAAGVYSFAAQAAMAVSLVCTSIDLAWAPWLYKKLASSSVVAGVKETVTRYVYGFHTMYLTLGIVYGAALTFAFRYAFPVVYRPAADCVALLATGVAFNAMYRTASKFIFYSRRTPYIATITVTSGAISLCCSWALIHTLGLRGAGISSLLSNIILFVVTWAVASRVYPMPYRSVLAAALRRA